MLVLIEIRQRYLLFVLFLSMTQAYAQNGLIVTEIMISPRPGSLPLEEYIEIYNHGSSVVSLKDIQLRVSGQAIPLPDHYLAPKQYMLLVAAPHAALFDHLGNVLGLSPWWTLSNTEGSIALVDRHDIVLHQSVMPRLGIEIRQNEELVIA